MRLNKKRVWSFIKDGVASRLDHIDGKRSIRNRNFSAGIGPYKCKWWTMENFKREQVQQDKGTNFQKQMCFLQRRLWSNIWGLGSESALFYTVTLAHERGAACSRQCMADIRNTRKISLKKNPTFNHINPFCKHDIISTSIFYEFHKYIF